MTLRRIAAVIACAFVPSLALAQCPDGFYPMICRGPVDMLHNAQLITHSSTAMHEVMFTFTRGDRAAGERGATLPRKMCAWVDRGFRTGEPGIGRLHLEHNPAQMGHTFEGILTAIDVCNANSNCRFRLCARNDTRHFAFHPWSVKITFE